MSRARLALGLTLVLVAACGRPALSQSDREGPIAGLRALAAAGRHEDVIRQAGGLIDALPVASRPTAWAIDWHPTTVDDIRIGQRHVYLVQLRSPGGQDAVASLAPLPNLEPRNDKGYDWLTHVTCVDGATGRRLWTRRFLPHTRIALDPRDDALWTWHRDPGTSILRTEPATGEATARGLMPATWKTTDAPRGLRVGGVRLWSLATANTRDLAVDAELDLDTGAAQRQAIHPDLLARNGLRYLRSGADQSPGDVTTAIQLVPPLANTQAEPAWSFPIRGYRANPPVWLGDDVLVLAGTSTTFGAVSRLDGKTGQVRWTRMLPEPAGEPGLPQLRGNGYPPRGWSAVGEAAGKVVAVGAFGTTFFLDPATGEEVGRVSNPTPLLALRRVIANRLILAGPDGVRASRPGCRARGRPSPG